MIRQEINKTIDLGQLIRTSVKINQSTFQTVKKFKKEMSLKESTSKTQFIIHMDHLHRGLRKKITFK